MCTITLTLCVIETKQDWSNIIKVLKDMDRIRKLIGMYAFCMNNKYHYVIDFQYITIDICQTNSILAEIIKKLCPKLLNIIKGISSGHSDKHGAVDNCDL